MTHQYHSVMTLRQDNQKCWVLTVKWQHMSQKLSVCGCGGTQ